MKQGKIKNSEEINKTKNHIYKVAPHINNIDVKIEKAGNGKFQSFIRVHIPPKKKLIAIKNGPCLKTSLERSRQAIIRQLNKEKEKKLRRQTLHSYFNDVA